jgi:putative phosphoribosyl transferase
MVFKNREDAGQQLARLLARFANQKDVIVLGIPRGGVSVAYEVARKLHAPLDIFLAQKLGVPGQEELAFGAIALHDGRFLDQEIIRAADISEEQIERITNEAISKLEFRATMYTGDHPPLHLQGRTVILVDDGIATGASTLAAIHGLRQMKPARLILAVPVAPKPSCEWLKSMVDEFVCVDSPVEFYGVGQFYLHFDQVPDEEVIRLLQLSERPPHKTAEANVSQHSLKESPRAATQRDVEISFGNISLAGRLVVPQNAKGIVLFAHGSGSSRFSPRNRRVAEVLHSRGFATLLFDLLTHEEESVDRWTAQMRFDTALLADRLIKVTHWIAENEESKGLSIGYFGASTGAAAALIAAAELPDRVTAVVSRGGRPDLAADALGRVRASTLLLVGELDGLVIRLNRQAFARMQPDHKQLMIIPGASHLFEEPGTLERVSLAAADWFAVHLTPAQGMKHASVAPAG